MNRIELLSVPFPIDFNLLFPSLIGGHFEWLSIGAGTIKPRHLSKELRNTKLIADMPIKGHKSIGVDQLTVIREIEPREQRTTMSELSNGKNSLPLIAFIAKGHKVVVFIPSTSIYWRNVIDVELHPIGRGSAADSALKPVSPHHQVSFLPSDVSHFVLSVWWGRWVRWYAGAPIPAS